VIRQVINSPLFLGPEDTDRACLLIHGFMGTPLEMQGLGEALATHDIRVYNMVVAGHTGNPEDLLRAGRKEWIASAEEGLRQLASYRYVFVAGLSMGGALALLLASLHAERIAGVVAMSSLTRLTTGGWQSMVLPLLPLARHLIKWFYPAAGLDFNDPIMQEEALKQARLRDPQATIDFSDPKVIAYIKENVRVPVSAIDELIHLTKEERRNLGKVRSPLLIIHSKRDMSVKLASAEELYRLATAASPKSLHWLERSDHVITVGPEREKVYELTIEFIEATIRRTEGPA
jgi:carboxylesterase